MGAESEHFKSWELACPCCGVNDCTQALVDALEAFRAVVGKPVVVDSAYRCPKHNAAEKGATHSQHMLGQAADVRVAGMSAAQLEVIARTIAAIHGIGRADHQGYLHVDVREDPAKWCYNTQGRQIAYYLPVSPETTVSA